MLVQGLCLSFTGVTGREDQKLSSKDLCPLTISILSSGGAGSIVGKATVTNVQIQGSSLNAQEELRGLREQSSPGQI